jgi:hypothetical protein
VAKYKLDLGMTVDLLTKDEVDQALEQAMSSWRQRAAGTDYVTRIALGVDAADYTIEGPQQGYAWSVKMVAAALSAAAILTAWWDAQMTLPAAPPAASAASAQISWGSDSLVLKPGRNLYLSTSTGTITSVLVAAWQIPAERVGLLR